MDPDQNRTPGITIAFTQVLPGGETVTASVASTEWDADIDTVGQLVRQVLLGAGYHPNAVRELFQDG